LEIVVQQVVVVIHLILAVGLIGVVLLQRSEGGGLGIGSSGGMGSFMSVRGTANLLTRTTAILAACFMATSIILAILAGGHTQPRSILDAPPAQTSPATPAPASPPQTNTPAVPLSR
jgi:preprotein translocase subunit SecG